LTLLDQFLFKKYAKFCYKSIDDISIYNWWEVLDGNSEYVRKLKLLSVVTYNERIKENLQQNYFDVFGVSEEFNKLFDNEVEILELEIERGITGNKFLGTQINILKTRVINATKEKRNNNLYEVKSYIDKYLGTRLDVKEISVMEFYSYLELMKKENGKQQD